MPNRLSKDQIAAELARRAGITLQQAFSVLDAQAQLAYEQAADGFFISGIGIFKLDVRPPRKMILRFGPDAGKVITIPARPKLKFKIAKDAKDALIGPNCDEEAGEEEE